MNYRRLGSAGLKISELSLGSWITYGGQVGEEVALKCMSAAHDGGVNFFDSAEAYAQGNAEIVIGNVIKKMGCPYPASRPPPLCQFNLLDYRRIPSPLGMW